MTMFAYAKQNVASSLSKDIHGCDYVQTTTLKDIHDGAKLRSRGFRRIFVPFLPPLHLCETRCVKKAP